ncbi:MAG TPA: glycosyltransferase [Solirubrobacteraceae bacterium]|nr:glycosyltransferase [Solirubrobacteraceae bacterium]
MARTDVLVVSIGSTTGWRVAAKELVASLSRAGAKVAIVRTGELPRVRTFALTDFVEARAARHATVNAIAEHDPAAIIYCSMTAALLWPKPGAVWLDSIAAENRPGRHGVWQRTVELRRLREAPMVLAMSNRALAPLDPADARDDVVVVPVPVESSGPAAPSRDVDVVAYASNPEKKRLDYVLEAWSRARRGNETLVVEGTDRVVDVEGVKIAGRMAPEDYRALLRRARVFVAAPVREDYGIAPLEALADGCMLVTTPSPGPYPALDIARELDPRLVADDLAPALRAALDHPVPLYAQRAAELVAPFSRQVVDRTVAQEVLPRLLTTWMSQ